ncbi:8-oxo-dGTP diphosphatase [Verrucomicrobiota bacterium]
MKLSDINWQEWQPTEVATLLFVIRDEQILLIRKKRGLGAGKINGPGGRIEKGETPQECAIRETQEELCITPQNVEFCGDLYFQFTSGFSIRGHVYKADDYEGEPTETDEAIPHWFELTKIPYHEMWEDDEIWIPHMLEGKIFSARYIFDGDSMLEHQIELH